MAHRTANVRVQNNTGMKLASVEVIHKYSSNYKERKAWKDIPSDQATPANFVVNYNTGALCTGYDWWKIMWQFEGENIFHFTDPANFREVFDVIENVAVDLIGPVATILATKVTPKTKLKPVDAALPLLVGKLLVLVAKELLNNEKTAGFKGHLLCADDANEVTTITINKDEVEFESPSGVSKTNSSARQVTVQE